MPRHQQVTTCRKSGGLVSKGCSCEHCALSVCEVCGAGEGTLTTDCPGVKVDYDRQQEACQTNLDFTDARGWHQGSPTERRAPRFVTPRPVHAETPRPVHAETPRPVHAETPQPVHAETSDIVEEVAYEIEELQLNREGATSVSGEELRQLLRKMQTAWHKPRLGGYNTTRVVGCACGWHCPPDTQNSDDAFALHVAQTYVSLVCPGPPVAKLERSLTQKAIAWAKADRVADQCSADVTRIAGELGSVYDPRRDPPSGDLYSQLEQAKAAFRIADQHAVQCDDEFRQAACVLVDALERGPIDDKTP